MISRVGRGQGHPDVSVIVATRDRPDVLDTTLAHLYRQRWPIEQWELVVVDGTASPAHVTAPAGLRLVVANAATGFDIPRSAAAARNIGVSLATASTLCFLDDDIVAHPRLIEAHVTAHRRTHAGAPRVVLGYRYRASADHPLPEPGSSWSRWPAWDPDEREEFLAAHEDQPDWGCLYSHNFSISRAEFLRSGGFDQNFEGCGVEDVEFGYRLHRAGVAFSLCRDAVGVHQHHERSVVRWRDNANNLKRLVNKHPELAAFTEEVLHSWDGRAPEDPEMRASLAELRSGLTG